LISNRRRSNWPRTAMTMLMLLGMSATEDLFRDIHGGAIRSWAVPFDGYTGQRARFSGDDQILFSLSSAINLKIDEMKNGFGWTSRESDDRKSTTEDMLRKGGGSMRDLTLTSGAAAVLVDLFLAQRGQWRFPFSFALKAREAEPRYFRLPRERGRERGE
jgi:hypothetical protein